MYHAIVAGRLRKTIDRISAGDVDYAARQFVEPVVHEFAGDHALGGRRQNLAAIRAWYARLHRVFPDLKFQIDAMHVSGWPWNTTGVVEWRDRFSTPNGEGSNLGVFVLTIRWGRVHRLSVHTDTDRLKRYLAEFAAAGLAEAEAAPIT